MSKVKIEGNASGTGTLTISAPNTNTDRSLTLPDGAGEILTDASTLSSSNLSGALPAIDGSALTGLSSGAVVQLVENSYTSTTSNATGSFIDTGVNATITPTSSSNDILISTSVNSVINGAGRLQFKIQRSINGGSYTNVEQWDSAFGWSDNDAGSVVMIYTDSPATTSSVVYKIQFAIEAGSGTMRVNQTSGTPSTMVLMEIA